ncbi:MAG: hypothetical protein AAGD09_15855, partial [Cyanobacteria bacterium P01_F01_bin.56]
VPEAYFGMMQATYFIGGGLKASLFFCLSIFSKLCPAYFRLALSPAKILAIQNTTFVSQPVQLHVPLT